MPLLPTVGTPTTTRICGVRHIRDITIITARKATYQVATRLRSTTYTMLCQSLRKTLHKPKVTKEGRECRHNYLQLAPSRNHTHSRHVMHPKQSSPFSSHVLPANIDRTQITMPAPDTLTTAEPNPLSPNQPDCNTIWLSLLYAVGPSLPHIPPSHQHQLAHTPPMHLS
jgi:hypothetical protein